MNSRFIIVQAVLTLTLHYNSMTLARKNVFQMAPNLDNVLFQNNSLFDVIVRSKFDCVTWCGQTFGCFFVTLYGNTRYRGHNVLHSNPALGTPTSGARTFIADKWLYDPCANDAHCAPGTRGTTIPNHVQCFEGLCLCVPGYYYSVSTPQCGLGCASSNLQSSFVRYPRHSIPNYNNATVHVTSDVICMQECLNYTNDTCRTVEYYASTITCNIAKVTALDVPANKWIFQLVTDTLQRKCA